MNIKYSQKIISNKTEYVSFEPPLSKHRIGSHETAFFLEILYINDDENIIIAPRQKLKK